MSGPIPESLSPAAAWDMLQEQPQVLLLDVRSEMEYLMIGHPTGAVNIAWIDAPDWTVNPQFSVQVRRLLLGRMSGKARTSVPIVLICRSGNRSADAAAQLLDEGFGEVYVVEGGFEGPLDEAHHRNTVAGWRFAGLPWEQC